MPLPGVSSFPLWVNLAIFAAAAVLVWTRGVRLTRHLDAIAVRTKLNHAFVGMLFLGVITTLPEFATVTTAAAIGNATLGINNIFGSVAINVLLLAIADAFVGRRAVTAIVAKPSTMMMAGLCMLVLMLIGALIALGDASVFGLSAGSAAITAASIFCFWLATGYDERSPWKVMAADVEGEPEPDRLADRESPLSTLWLRTAIDGGLLCAGGYALSITGDSIAAQTGIASALIGFALIGLATSMPEMSTIITALRLRRPEMAFGQVLGANFMNMSMFIVADVAFAGPPVLQLLGAFEIFAALLAAMMIGIFLIGLLEHRDRTLFRMGYDSAFVIVLFGVGFAFLATA